MTLNKSFINYYVLNNQTKYFSGLFERYPLCHFTATAYKIKGNRITETKKEYHMGSHTTQTYKEYYPGTLSTYKKNCT